MGVLEIKAAVRARDGHRCTECGMTNEEHRKKIGRSLEVHRLTPGSPYTIEGCQTLCRYCHSSKPKRTYGLGAIGDALQLTLEFQDRLERVAKGLCIDVKSLVRMILTLSLPKYEDEIEERAKRMR